MKVIIRAVFDWVSYRKAPKLQQRKYADDAYRWLFLPNETFNSFESVCFYLDLRPDDLRNWAAGLTPEQVLKIELADRSPNPRKLAEVLNLKYLLEDFD